MRRSIQSVSPSKLFHQATQVPYVCSSCRHQAQSLQLQTIRNASSGLPFTERLRRKIWGTDSPPGLKDPYGGPSYFERRRQDSQTEREVIEPPAEEPETFEPEPPPTASQRQNAKKSGRFEEVYMHDPVKEDSSYEPADTWDGLPRVGTSRIGHAGQGGRAQSFRPFLSTSNKATAREEVLSLMHQAVVEVVTLNDAMPPRSRDLGQIQYTPDVMASISSTVIDLDITGKHIVLRYQRGGREKIIRGIRCGLHENRSSPVSEEQDAEAGMQYTSARENGGERHIHDETENEEGSNDMTGGRLRVTTEHPDSTGSISHKVTYVSFLMLPMDPLELRFSIIKRLSQLAGHRIPDPLLSSSKTLMPIYNYLLRNSSPKPTKLADGLLKKKDLASLPNVHVMARRETPIDKDKRLGRWKVIEAELQSKGLPVLSKSRV